MFRKILVAFGLGCAALALIALGATAVTAQTLPNGNQRNESFLNVPVAQSCSTPTIQYAYANPPTISPGQVTTLYWGSVLGAQAAYLQYPNGNRQGIGTPGSQQVNPTQTTTYYIIGVCGNYQAQMPITVNVQGGPTCSGAPQLNGFTASPSVIAPGQGSTLSWGQVNNADYVQLSSQTNGGSGVPTPGSSVVYPGQTTTYYLTAWCQGNSAQAQVTVTVNNAPAPTPTPTNSNQITELQYEKKSKGVFYLTIKYYWNGADAPATIQSWGYNEKGQVVTDRPSTTVIAGYYKYVYQTMTNIGSNGAVVTITSCIVGKSGTELVCKSIPGQ